METNGAGRPGRLSELEDACRSALLGARSRLFAGAAGACVVIPILGLAFAAAWTASIVVFELLRFQVLRKQVRLPVTPAHARRVEWLLAMLTGLSTCLYGAGFALAWLHNRELGMFIGATWVATSLNYDLVYNSAIGSIFFASTAPLMGAAGLIPLMRSGVSVETLCMYAMIAVVAAISIAGMRDRRRMQQAIIKAETSRQAAEAAHGVKTRLLATFSHELRTPVNAIIGFAELLEEGLHDSARSAEAADAGRIARAGRHLIRGIDQILLIADTDAVQGPSVLRTISVRAFLEAEMARLAPDGAACAYTIDCEPFDISIDADALRACLAPLVENALRFGAGAPVAVIAKCMHVASDQLEFIVQIVDRGPGIAASAQARIFEPFVQGDDTTTRGHDGLGLGLAIASHFARRLSGQLRVESVETRGATFELRAPARPHGELS